MVLLILSWLKDKTKKNGSSNNENNDTIIQSLMQYCPIFFITQMAFVLPQLGAPTIGFISLYFEIQKIQDAIFAFDVYKAYAILITYNISVS